MKKIRLGVVALFVFLVQPPFLSFSAELPDLGLQVKTYEGIPYVSGGVGLEERKALQRMGKEDNLELSFALQNKQYLGGAEVLIKDDKGKTVLEAASDGPLFFSKLPSGKYTVKATAMGKTLEQVAHVPSKGQADLHFTWNEAKEETQTGALAKQVTHG